MKYLVSVIDDKEGSPGPADMAAGHPEDGELLYACKRATVWLSHVAAVHHSAVESQGRLLARLFIKDEGVG